VTLSDEQLMLVDAVRSISAGGVTDTPPVAGITPIDTTSWRHLVDAGFVGLRAPPGAGGGGASAVEVALIVEETGRALTSVPFLGTVLAVELLTLAGAPDPVIAPIVDGDRTAAVVLDTGLVAPARSGIAFDGTADALVVALDGRTATTVTAGAPIDSADLTRAMFRVTEPGEPIGAPLSDASIARWQAFALAMLSADLVGVMDGALCSAVEHIRAREQYGRPVGSFQALQHLCADQLVSVESARSAMWHAAWAVDQLQPDDALDAARVAKAYASELAPAVCETSIQLWGGLGMTWECSAHVSLRRALVDARVLGDARTQLGAIADRRLA